MERVLYDDHFQLHFVGHLVRDSLFASQVADEVTPELFSSELAQRAVRVAKVHITEHKAAPGPLIFRHLDDLKESRALPEDLHKNLTSYIDGLFALDLQNRAFLLKEFDKFLRHQRFSTRILPITKLVKEGAFDKAEAELREIFTYRAARKLELGRKFEKDPTKRIHRRTNEDTSRIWLLIPELDSLIRGCKRGQLFVWQSQRSSGGKSAAMVFCTRSFVFQGLKVLIVSLEMDEEDYEDRLDMCVGGMVEDSLLDRNQIQLSMHRWFKQGGDVWIKQLPGRLTCVDDLKKLKAALENVHNFVPDVIIVDYADELRPSDARVNDSSFDAGKRVYSELKAWAVEDHVLIVTGMQSNRSGMDAGVADMEHSGESIAKSWIADIMISLNRSPAEEQANLMSLFIVKHRKGRARVKITIRTDFTRMQFWKRNEE